MAGKGSASVAARLFGEEHRQALVAALVRIGAHEQRHQVGAHRVGDPGLGAVDDVAVAVAGRAGAQAREVGAGVRLGEDGSRQDFAARDLRQVFLFLRLGAADEDELGGDLGPGAERTDADIAARQFLRHDAHRDLAESHAAVGLRDGEAEDAHAAKAGDDLERDIGVGAMPTLRVGDDLGVGEAAHLAADRLEGLVKARIADRAFARLPDQGGEGGAVFRSVAPGDQGLDDFVAKRLDLVRAEAEVGQAHDFALVHRNAAEHLREIFAQPDPRQQLLGLAEAALLAHAPSIGGHFLDRFDIGRKPCEAMGRVLLGLDLRGAELAVVAHPVAHGGQRAIHEALGGEVGLAGEVVERHGASFLQLAPLLRRSMRRRAPSLQSVFFSPPHENRPCAGGARPAPGQNVRC